MKAILVLSLMLSLATLPASAQTKLSGVWGSLNLNKQQTERVENIQKIYWDRLKQRRDEVVTRMKEWLDLYQAKKADEATLKVRQQRVEQAQQAMNEVHYEYYMALRKVLSPDQYKKLADSKLDRLGRSVALTRHCEMCGME